MDHSEEQGRVVLAKPGGYGSGSYGLYWMRAAARGVDNPALDWALARAAERRIPLAAVFVLNPGFPGASTTHYRFMLGGLAEAARALAKKGVPLAWAAGEPASALEPLLGAAAFLATDAAYLRYQRRQLDAVVRRSPCPVAVADGNVVVPVVEASGKEEWSAYTLRRKLHPLLGRYLRPPEEREAVIDALDFPYPRSFSRDFGFPGPAAPGGKLPGAEPLRLPEQRLSEAPGATAALARLRAFLAEDLERYGRERNDPLAEATSRLSAYLHFGQISPVRILREALASRGERDPADCADPSLAAFVEELAVRRELSFNFVAHREDYDAPDCLPDWARRTLSAAASDRREAQYGLRDFEDAATHDPYWNAAQNELVRTGRMSGYMRMYWGKGFLAWSPTPEDAWKWAVTLNDAYSLDGRDPNGYAGIAWCFGKHDRPWTGRPVFGTVRYMNAAGLRRKFDADAYVRGIAALRSEAQHEERDDVRLS